MLKSDWIRLRHMLDAAKEARSFIKNEERASIEKDRKLVLALIKSIEIIGEAANKVTKEGREGIPQIPWPNIISMRNRLIHAYFDINLDILWETVNADIPELIEKLEKILPSDKI